MLVVGGRQKRGLVMIEPPGDARRGGVLEVHNGVFVAREILLVKERAGAVHQAVIFVGGIFGYALAVEAREQRSRAGAIETLVVIEDPYPQNRCPSQRKPQKSRNC